MLWDSLGPRQKQIADLLIQGCDNAEIAKTLKMAQRTVKAHFNRMFLRAGITDGIKRVKLAVILYREQQIRERQGDANAKTTDKDVACDARSDSPIPGSSARRAGSD